MSTTGAAMTGNEASTSTNGACGILALGSSSPLAGDDASWAISMIECSSSLAGDDACASIGWETLTTGGSTTRLPSPEGRDSKNTHSPSTAAKGSTAAAGRSLTTDPSACFGRPRPRRDPVMGHAPLQNHLWI